MKQRLPVNFAAAIYWQRVELYKSCRHHLARKLFTKEVRGLDSIATGFSGITSHQLFLSLCIFLHYYFRAFDAIELQEAIFYFCDLYAVSEQFYLAVFSAGEYYFT